MEVGVLVEGLAVVAVVGGIGLLALLLAPVTAGSGGGGGVDEVTVVLVVDGLAVKESSISSKALPPPGRSKQNPGNALVYHSTTWLYIS